MEKQTKGERVDHGGRLCCDTKQFEGGKRSRPVRVCCTVIACTLLWTASSALAQLEKEVELYRWVDFELVAPEAATGVAKWDVDGHCSWIHEDGQQRRTSLVWYCGVGDSYIFRFGGALPGRWTGTSRSSVAALDGVELAVSVTPSSNPDRVGWSGWKQDEPRAWAHHRGPSGELAKRTPILVMMPNVRTWHDDLAHMRAFVAEFNEAHGFNGGHISTIGRSWFDADSAGNLRDASPTPDPRTFAALEAAASEWTDRGGWLHLWMWGKGSGGNPSNLPGGYAGPASQRLNRYIAARLGPVPGWSMGIGWDVEFWADRALIEWWLNDLVSQLDLWHHWVGLRYSDSDTGQGADPEPANRGKYRDRGIAWNTILPAQQQYAGWEHWRTETDDRAIAAAASAFPDRPMMSEDRFRRRDGKWPQKDFGADDEVLVEIPRWAEHGIGAIYGRLIDSQTQASDVWPNRSAIRATIERVEK